LVEHAPDHLRLVPGTAAGQQDPIARFHSA
jgi:hypothetical protein